MANLEDDDDDDKPYEVGYGKPPKHTRFKPGQSGNQKGRPKGARGLYQLVEAELRRMVTINENGKSRRVRVESAIIRSLFARAAQGSPRHIAIVLELMRECGEQPVLQYQQDIQMVFVQADGTRFDLPPPPRPEPAEPPLLPAWRRRQQGG